MAQTLESIKGGGGSIKLGTTGTVSSLMTRELDNISSAPCKQLSSRNQPRTFHVSAASGSTTTSNSKGLQPRKLSDKTNSSGSNGSINHRCAGIAQKTKINSRYTHQIPMLRSDNFLADTSPIREKNDKKITNIVEVVDIKCGNPDKAWGGSLRNRLKKLGFSKLSQSII